jgi:hypothetical protein
MVFAIAILPNNIKVTSDDWCFKKIPGGYKAIHPHQYKYSYVRGRDDIFDQYPFPIWIAQRSCRKCLHRQVLAPSFQDFNSKYAGWIEEEILC